MEYEIYPIDELYHHGVRGMKWGIRRYQRKDGSLTNAGKKHRAALEGNSGSGKIKTASKTVSKTRGSGNTKTTVKKTVAEEPAKKKTLAEMTNDEVRDATMRMQLEKQYHDAARSLAASNPKQVSKGQKFLNSVMNDVIVPAAKDAGRKWMTNFMEDKLGLNKKSELQRLEDKWKKLDYKKKISDLEKGIRDNEDTSVSDIEKKWKKLDYEKKISDLEKPKNDDPYGIKDVESRWKKLDYEKKISELENPTPKTEKIDWDSKTKESQFYRDAFKTESARRDYETYLNERETLGAEEAWERYKKRQGGN